MPDSDGAPRELGDTLSALPLFPLPGTVFFPHTLLPLHVFEPRYRQMTEHVLESDGLMAIVLERGAEESASAIDERGLADLHGVAGLGRVVHHERLPDGRFHILLQGLERVELTRALPDDGLLYRRAAARVLEAPAHDAAALARELDALKANYARVIDRCSFAREQLGDLTRRVAHPGVLADVVCACILDDPRTRQAALEDACVVGRLKRANDALLALLLGNLEPEAALVH